MPEKLYIYNTLHRKKEVFQPLNPPFAGMYVCGPTVYGDPHLGHARPAITFDVLFRYLQHLDFKVRYVRNITDVGHLENDADAGEDKIGKLARLQQIEPMEVAQYYSNRYHHFINQLNVLPPSIEPQASGHIIEQIELIKTLVEKGLAYETKYGSVYFDVDKYNEKYNYGQLSGRKLEDMISNTRELDGQDEKRKPYDFALWKKASKEHIMRWPSPWSEGFPGWHLECSAMGAKYLGETFDIHGGGLDLLFPHHECEIAQSKGAHGHDHVKYWMHNNMITINGQKMGKSLGNFITLEELFSGNHDILEQAYSPLTIRFFILQAHYRSTLDFSNEALQAAEKGLNRLAEGIKKLDSIQPKNQSTVNVAALKMKCYAAINDDLNTPILIAHLFDGIKTINTISTGKESINKEDLLSLKKMYQTFFNKILGLELPAYENTLDKTSNEPFEKAVDLLLQLRMDAKSNKDWATSDKIRDELKEIGFEVKDTKEGFEWKLAD